MYIRPDTASNGTVERSHGVDDQEFYELLDKDGITDDIHLFNEKLRGWRTTTITTGLTKPSAGRPVRTSPGQD